MRPENAGLRGQESNAQDSVAEAVEEREVGLEKRSINMLVSFKII